MFPEQAQATQLREIAASIRSKTPPAISIGLPSAASIVLIILCSSLSAVAAEVDYYADIDKFPEVPADIGWATEGDLGPLIWRGPELRKLESLPPRQDKNWYDWQIRWKDVDIEDGGRKHHFRNMEIGAEFEYCSPTSRDRWPTPSERKRSAKRTQPCAQE